jgi:hypothetical protein
VNQRPFLCPDCPVLCESTLKIAWTSVASALPSRVCLLLIRNRDRKPVGMLTIVRAQQWAFFDERGKRRATPVRTDQFLITLTDAKGEEVCYLEVPMDHLPADA